MIKAVAGKNEACLEICRVLGFDIKRTRGIELRMYADEIVTVKAEIYPDDAQLKLVGSVLKKFKLVETK